MEEYKEVENCCNCGRFIAGGAYKNTLLKQGYSFPYCSVCTDAYRAHKEEDENEPAEAPDGSEKARVKGFPVRYNGRRYKPGVTLYVETVDFNSNLFEKVE